MFDICGSNFISCFPTSYFSFEKKKKKKIQKLQVIFLGQYKASHFQYSLKKFLLASQLSSLIFLSEFPITNLHLPHPNCNFFIGHIHIKVPKRIKTNMFQQS